MLLRYLEFENEKRIDGVGGWGVTRWGLHNPTKVGHRGGWLFVLVSSRFPVGVRRTRVKPTNNTADRLRMLLFVSCALHSQVLVLRDLHDGAMLHTIDAHDILCCYNSRCCLKEAEYMLVTLKQRLESHLRII